MPPFSLLSTAAAVGAATTPDRETDLASLLATAADGNQSPISAAEAFWIQGPVDLSRWNKLFPYQLVVVRAMADGNGAVTYQPEPGWSYTFPIPPEGISFGMPMAINVQATQGGIVEEHNGAPFRVIQLRGSTGVLPGRGRAEQQTTPSIFGSALIGGTVAALNRVGDDAASIVSSAIGSIPENANLHRFSEFEMTDSASGPSAYVAKTTGYYQLRRLEAFMEAYVAEKKRRTGRNLRLALCIWKKEAVYLVTPVSFDYSKTGDGGLEEPFSLTFKAWKRVRLEVSGFRPVLPEPVRRDPSVLARGLNTLIAARRTLQGLSAVATAIVGDYEHTVGEPLRQVALLTKDLLGVQQSISELPAALAKVCFTPYIEAAGRNLDAAATAVAGQGSSSVQYQQKLAGAAAAETKDRTKGTNSLSATQARARALKGHQAAKAFEKPSANFELMNSIGIGGLKLPPAIRRQIDAETARVRNLRRKDFERMRDQVRGAADLLAIALGAGDPTFEDTYNIRNVHQVKTEPTDSDWEALFALNDSVIFLDGLAATSDGEPSATQEHMEVMAGLARRSGIAFKVPRSKFAVPFPYGSTLENLALTYLGDATRWHEIAALNGLREPYVDETGFDLSLSVNGSEHQVVVSDATHLYIGQTVWIWSDQVRRTRRRILGLRAVGATTVITLDGDPDMSLYKTEDDARLSSFLPDTVNSQSLIYIPSDAESFDDDAITKEIPGVNEFDPMVAASGVDFLLDSFNDLVITPDGDNRWAAGLVNVVQHVRVSLSVQRGTLLFHPEYGLPISVGMSTADFDAPSVLQAVRRMFAEDPAIVSISAVAIDKSGPTASISASIVVAGTERPVPLRFNVDRGFAASGPSV